MSDQKLDQKLDQLLANRLERNLNHAAILLLVGAFPTSDVDRLISKVPSDSPYLLIEDSYNGDPAVVYFKKGNVVEAQRMFRAYLEFADIDSDSISLFLFSSANEATEPDVYGRPVLGTRRLLGFRQADQIPGDQEKQTKEEKRFYTKPDGGFLLADYGELGTYLDAEVLYNE